MGLMLGARLIGLLLLWMLLGVVWCFYGGLIAVRTVLKPLNHGWAVQVDRFAGRIRSCKLW